MAEPMMPESRTEGRRLSGIRWPLDRKTADLLAARPFQSERDPTLRHPLYWPGTMRNMVTAMARDRLQYLDHMDALDHWENEGGAAR